MGTAICVKMVIRPIAYDAVWLGLGRKEMNNFSAPLHGNCSYLFQRNLCGVLEVAALPLEERVRLVPDDEHNVGGDLVGRLVALALERDLGAALPARLHVDGEHLEINRACVHVRTCVNYTKILPLNDIILFSSKILISNCVACIKMVAETIF